MAEYGKVKLGKLKLKGEQGRSHKKHKKHKKKEIREGEKETPKQDDDAILHGDWWKISTFDEITGSVAIEFGQHMYIKALDNGLFTLGAPHDEGDGPAPEEILTAFRVSDTKIALKSGYGKYLKVGPDSVVVGRSDAVGTTEQWEPVFEEGRLALLGCNSCFMSIRDSDDAVVATSPRVQKGEILQVRSNVARVSKKSDVPEEEQGNLSQVEVNYVRKFQKFQDKKLRVNQEDRTDLKRAKVEGTLHETLLDRRSKMKADRYCK